MKERSENEAVEEQPLDGQVVTGQREYTLKKPITHKGRPRVTGDKVKLNDRQAKRLKGSEHI